MDALPAAMFAAGLASSIHCVGMCGGIVAAFDAGDRRVIPIRPAGAVDAHTRRIAFNAGRITTYAMAGAVASALGAAVFAAGFLPAQQAAGIATSVMLTLMGLYLLGFGRLLAPLEAIGAPLWRRLMPLAARLLPARTRGQAYAAGLLWGLLPCAMVYAALGVAAFAGSAARAALAMAAFGLGTLPLLLLAGGLAFRLRAWRSAAGALLLGFGVFSLAHAGALGDAIRHSILCL